MSSSLDKRIKGAANEEIRRIYSSSSTVQNCAPKRQGPIKRHNCLSSAAKSEICLKSARSRPTTRRNNLNVVDKELLTSSPSCAMGPFPKAEKLFRAKQRKRSSVMSPRSTNSEMPSQSTSLRLDVPNSNNDQSDHASEPHSKRSNSNEDKESTTSHQETNTPTFTSSEEHEYLLFLLRITEDIISNDFYSNNDIKKIFKMHMNLNKDRLDGRKMHLHIANLCKELNIDCKEYQTAELSEESPDLCKFQNTPNGHILNNKEFRNCHECSAIRTSSLYKMHNATGEHSMSLLDNGENASISPSLLKLLEKLSLGRVTECTEPPASMSTIDSPSLNEDITNIDDTNDNKDADQEKSPANFETFIEELTSKEVVDEKSAQDDPHDTPNMTVVVEDLDILIQELKDTEMAKPSVEASNEDSEKNESHVEKIEMMAPEKEKSTTETNENSCEKEPNEVEKVDESTTVLPKTPPSSLTDKEEEEGEALELKAIFENPQKPSEASISLTSVLNQVSSEIIPDVEPEPIVLKEEATKTLQPSLGATTDQQVAATADKNTAKVIIQSDIKDEDYVMVKGPMYVYKPLLESEPKLIIFPENSENKASRRNSNESNRTFTVDQSQVLLEEAVQYEASLHSMEFDKSMDNILTLTKTAYGQFADTAKLLHSDYDLTPEKDETDNKYHHLLLDATTSISGVNIPRESLLLTDDYLVKNSAAHDSDCGIKPFDSDEAIVESRSNNISIDQYLRFEPKLYENNYVRHRTLTASHSLPKIEKNLPSSHREDFLQRPEKVGNILKKCSSDLIGCERPSQDSSLRCKLSWRGQADWPILLLHNSPLIENQSASQVSHASLHNNATAPVIQNSLSKHVQAEIILDIYHN